MSMQGGNPKKPKGPVCSNPQCRRSLASGPKTIIEGMWYCERCTYIKDYGVTPEAVPKRKKSVPLQEEKLFEVRPQHSDRG